PLGVAALMAGCGPAQAPNTVPVTTTPTRNAPAWIDNEEIPDGLAAVGIAQANVMGDKSMQRTVAIGDARTKLAGKLKVRVQNMFSQLNQQVTTASSAPEGKGKPIRNEVMNRVVENVTRQLVDQELSGTSVRNFWTDPSDGNLYVLVVMTKDSMDRALAGAAQNQIRREISQGEQSLEKALDKLDAAIAASDKAAN
ncbi:MAG TPA: LPP20 family lipoprotein, partial [Holophaga sp.]|nr:LPP20 family lipoprotein [Holophaga sp.]